MPLFDDDDDDDDVPSNVFDTQFTPHAGGAKGHEIVATL
jgi:hypothetical protein